MANETQIGQLVIDLKIKTNALEKGLETAKKKIQEIENQNNQLKNSNKQIDTSFIAMSATAVASLIKIGSAIKDCIDEYNLYTQAMSSLSNVADYTNQNLNDMNKLMNKYSSIINKSDLATTIKNFSLMGFTIEQTDKMIQACTDSAIRNRQANYTVSEAVRVASEGYRQGLSTLSDAAGVTENLSVMLDKYAQSIGKTASQLTEAEKNQAYLNRTMYAAEPFAGAMSSYMDTLAGKQGQYNQSLRETQVAFTEALEPTLKKIEELKTNAIETFGDLISSNNSATVGMTTFIVTLGIFTVGLTTAKKAYDVYKASTIAATISTKGFTAALAANPIGAVAVAISLVISAFAGYKSAVDSQTESQAKLNQKELEYNNILAGRTGYTETEISNAEKRKENIQRELSLITQIILERQKLYALKPNSEVAKEQKNAIKDLEDEYEVLTGKTAQSNEELQNSTKGLNEELDTYTKFLNKANTVKNTAKSFDIDTIKNQQQEAAQLKINANKLQEYLTILKNADKSSTQYQNAVNEIAKAYPEASSAGGILIDVFEGIVSAQQLQADEAWQASQTTIKGHIENIQAALKDENIQRQVAQNMGIAYDSHFASKLRTILALLQAIGGYQPEEVPNIKPVSTPKVSSGSKSYSNKALDNYKSLIEYKKSLDKISLEEEIKMYQTALNKYAKTTEEKRELTTKIYELKKELQEENLDDYISKIEHKKALDKISLEEEIKNYEYAYKNLAKTTEQKQELEEKLYELRKELAQKNQELMKKELEAYEENMEEKKKILGAGYTSKDQEKDYDELIQLHTKYLDEILRDERLSLEERKEIYEEEMQTIKNYEQQKRDLRVQSIDNTVSQLTSAITKQLEEMEDADKKAIESNIELVEKWKDTRINAINEEYDARIEAIQKELDLLDNSEEEKTRLEEDAEFERKRNRLQELIDYEHDATTKANYQKELDKLVADYQDTLDKRALKDKKDALKEKQNLLKEEQSSKVEAIENEAEKQKEQYNTQLDEIEKYYKEQQDKAQETAEKMLLNVDDNQKKILDLLKNYGDAYEITGQSLGEKLAQGINSSATSKIESAIKTIQKKLDTGIENKIKNWTSGIDNAQSKTNQYQAERKNITVNQTNNIMQNPEMPSETYRKLKDMERALADQLAGV